jgi:hypothetical protein
VLQQLKEIREFANLPLTAFNRSTNVDTLEHFCALPSRGYTKRSMSRDPSTGKDTKINHYKCMHMFKNENKMGTK